jgi:hypothetical protein
MVLDRNAEHAVPIPAEMAAAFAASMATWPMYPVALAIRLLVWLRRCPGCPNGSEARLE